VYVKKITYVWNLRVFGRGSKNLSQVIKPKLFQGLARELPDLIGPGHDKIL